MINAHLVHGFNVRDGGKQTTDRLIPFIEKAGINVTQHDYGFLEFVGVLRKNKEIAAQLSKVVLPSDIGIGHSNGCPILVKAARQGANFDKLILINPALNKSIQFPRSINEIHVFHTEHDRAVVAAKWSRKLVFWRSNFLWGEMGNKGYQGQDKRVVNHDISNIAKGHSEIFSRKNLNAFESILLKIINKKALS